MQQAEEIIQTFGRNVSEVHITGEGTSFPQYRACQHRAECQYFGGQVDCPNSGNESCPKCVSHSVQSYLAHPVSQDVIQSAQKSMMEQNVWSNVLLMIQDRTANLSTAEYDKKWPAINSGTPWENDRAIGIGCSVRTCAR